MDTPLVSVVIPVYNGANYLKEAIDSVLAQTYKSYEIIIVNDGSVDNGATERIALSYSDKVRYYKKENGGVATALNFAIQHMRGDFFSWLSHDDLYYPDKLETQIRALYNGSDPYAIVYSDYDLLDMNTGEKNNIDLSGLYEISQLENSVFPILFNLIHGCSLLIHKSHFQRVGVFDETLPTTQDYDLWFRMFRGQKLKFVPKPLICGRLHDQQGTRTISSHRMDEGKFYLKAIEILSGEELCDIFGHPAFAYRHVEELLNKLEMPDASLAVAERYRALQIPTEGERFEKWVQEWFQELRGNTSKICIFCCGQYGQALHRILRDLGISVDYFSDNNPALWGQDIDGCPCISPDQLYEISEDMLVLVAVRTPQPILEQLEGKRVLHVATKQQIDSKFAAYCRASHTADGA